MEIRKYSYSKINLFNSCPLKYKFIYIDKNYKKDESIEAFLGKLIHQTLEWIYKQKVNQYKTYFSLDTIVNFYKEKWNDNWHYNILKYKYIKQTKVDYFTAGVNYLVKYYQNFGPNFNEPVYKVEENLEFDLRGYKIKAIIDRIDKSDKNQMDIIDYKTGKKMLNEKKMKQDMQMAIYGIGLLKRYPEIKKINLSHYYVANHKTVSVSLSDIDTDKFSDSLVENIETIENSESENKFIPVESKLCNWCYYWKECSAKKTNNPSEYLR